MTRPLRSLRRVAILAVALVLAAGAAPPPKYGPLAVPLSRDQDFVRRAPAPDFWALMPYYTGQFNDMACSVASVAIALNGVLHAGRTLSNDARNVTQEALLERVRSFNWKERVTPGGTPLKGLTLAELELAVRASFAAFGAADAQVQRVDAGPGGLEEFRRVLVQNEASARDVVIVHFVQDALTGAPGGPYAHISPIGAYDAARRRVLVLDVDREWYEPYWVPDEALWDAMSRRTLRFGAGGYVRVSRAH